MTALCWGQISEAPQCSRLMGADTVNKTSTRHFKSFQLLLVVIKDNMQLDIALYFIFVM